MTRASRTIFEKSNGPNRFAVDFYADGSVLLTIRFPGRSVLLSPAYFGLDKDDLAKLEEALRTARLGELE